MKKILFTAYTLDIGGIETALITLLNTLVQKYDITLVLEKKQGVFLKELNPKIKTIEYKPNNNKNILVRKGINLYKRLEFISKYKNKYDFAGSFATYSKMGSFCARTASKNNALWIHTNYLEFYKNNIKEIMNFFEFIDYAKFNKYIFVSQDSLNSFKAVFTDIESKCICIHNLINDKRIIEKSKENIQLKKENEPTFLNVARHDEPSKKITRILSIAEKLKEDNIKFRILLIGDGPDNNMYKNLVKEKKLENNIIFLGAKTNPYPYFKISDAILLTSEVEGYPVIFDEARVLNTPIITTNVSDALTDIDGNFGIITTKEIDDIYIKIKRFIESNYKIENKFNAQSYNKENLSKLKNLFEGDSNA